MGDSRQAYDEQLPWLEAVDDEDGPTGLPARRMLGALLVVLLAAGLVVVEQDGSVRYGPASADLEALVDGVATFYAKSPDAVRRLIVAAANPGVSAFADAFRLRKE